MKLTEKNLFTPDNIPEKGEWYFFDLPKLTQWFGGEEKNIQPVFLEEVFGTFLYIFIVESPFNLWYRRKYWRDLISHIPWHSCRTT